MSGKFFNVSFWLNKHSDESARHGYTPATEDEKALLRLGPFVIAWEVVEW